MYPLSVALSEVGFGRLPECSLGFCLGFDLKGDRDAGPNIKFDGRIGTSDIGENPLNEASRFRNNGLLPPLLARGHERNGHVAFRDHS